MPLNLASRRALRQLVLLVPAAYAGAPGDAIYSSEVGATTILGAGKLTGKTANGWSMGFLNAVTGRERASWTDTDRIEQRHEVEPAANYFAGRVRRELRSGQTVIGGLVTGVNRGLGGSPLESDLHASAFSGGIDLLNEWDNRTWSLEAHLSPSRVSGSREAMISTQRASSRYFQRPEAFRFDSAATSLDGYSAYAALEKQAGLYPGDEGGGLRGQPRVRGQRSGFPDRRRTQDGEREWRHRVHQAGSPLPQLEYQREWLVLLELPG